MNKADYEYECMRADLLGLEYPEPPADNENETIDPENLMVNSEQIDRTTTGLDELNTILASTKKKLTRYQWFCGLLGCIISSPEKRRSSSKECVTEQTELAPSQGTQSSNSKVSGEPIEREVERQIDKLDAMLMKMDNAELSFKENNKLIKKIIRK